MRRPRRLPGLAVLAVLGCGGGSGAAPGPKSDAAAPSDAGAEVDAGPAPDARSADAAQPGPDAAPPPAGLTAVTYDYGTWSLEPYQEIVLCVAWTLKNEQPLYAQTFRMRNGGSVHHANWYVVPEALFDGSDGFFNCEARGFTETAAVLGGTPIFAQSTQAQYEEQTLGPGIAIKVPGRHRIVAAVHLLNLSSRRSQTFMQTTLMLLHPRDVSVVAAPFRLFYNDLHIPPHGDSRFETTCDLTGAVRGQPDFRLRLFYALPHYHQLGSGFRLALAGGADDGRPLFGIDGFNADANGRRIEPPAELAPGGATGFRFACDYRNPSARTVEYGLADGEMCMMLGFADSPILFNAGVSEGDAVAVPAESAGGVEIHRGPCTVQPVPRKVTQDMPTDAERAAPLYVPEGASNRAEPVAPPACADARLDAPAGPERPTLADIRDEVFRPACAFSACHGGDVPAAGLLLDGEVGPLRDALLHHRVQADTVLRLVVPGDALASWLFQLVAFCEPRDDTGRILRHMPLNAPELLDERRLARLRDWIDGGAE